MLTLVEPINMSGLSDRPHLGCAMLIAACQEKGIKTTLIQGQTRYLKDMFINDTEESWGLMQDLKDEELKKIKISAYKKFIRKKGIKQFQDELKDLYHKVIIDRNLRHYFNVRMIEKFNNLYNVFVAIYFYYLRELNYGELKIIDRYVSEVIKSNPRYIGFSLEGSFEPLSRTIRKRIKELTEIPIIVGGALTPFIDLKKLDKTFKEEYFDYLVIGAGECALPSLIQALEDKKEPKGIMNVFYKKDNEIKGNDLGVINDLDSLPFPDYSQFDLDRYLTLKRILPLQTTRGCSWRKCAFCSLDKINLGKHIFFSIEKIIETLRYLNNAYSCHFFSFNQEDLSPNQARRISEAILSNNWKNIYIYSPARLEGEYNNTSLLQLMRKAGFVQLHWGMESGSQRVLNLMNKGTDIKTMSQILKKSFKSGISNSCFIFFGFPRESKEEAQQTIEFLKKHAIYITDICSSTFKFEKSSPIGRNPERWGIEIKGVGGYLTKNGMNLQEASAFYSKFEKKFNTNSIIITSNKLKYLWGRHNRIMMSFLISGHNMLSNKTLMKYLEKNRLNVIFPIVLGEVKEISGEIVLFPINIKETPFINDHFPEKEEVLDRLEEKIFILSDGTLSVEDIIFTIYKDFKRKHRRKYIHKKCTDFFQNIFSKNWGLGFAKSWR